MQLFGHRNKISGEPFECQNFIANHGVVQLKNDTASGCHGVGSVDCPAGQIELLLDDTGPNAFIGKGTLVNFGCTQSLTQSAEPDLWASTVTIA